MLPCGLQQIFIGFELGVSVLKNCGTIPRFMVVMSLPYLPTHPAHIGFSPVVCHLRGLIACCHFAGVGPNGALNDSVGHANQGRWRGRVWLWWVGGA